MKVKHFAASLLAFILLVGCVNHSITSSTSISTSSGSNSATDVTTQEAPIHVKASESFSFTLLSSDISKFFSATELVNQSFNPIQEYGGKIYYLISTGTLVEIRQMDILTGNVKILFSSERNIVGFVVISESVLGLDISAQNGGAANGDEVTGLHIVKLADAKLVPAYVYYQLPKASYTPKCLSGTSLYFYSLDTVYRAFGNDCEKMGKFDTTDSSFYDTAFYDDFIYYAQDNTLMVQAGGRAEELLKIHSASEYWWFRAISNILILLEPVYDTTGIRIIEHNYYVYDVEKAEIVNVLKLPAGVQRTFYTTGFDQLVTEMDYIPGDCSMAAVSVILERWNWSGTKIVSFAPFDNPSFFSKSHYIVVENTAYYVDMGEMPWKLKTALPLQ